MPPFVSDQRPALQPSLMPAGGETEDNSIMQKAERHTPPSMSFRPGLTVRASTDPAPIGLPDYFSQDHPIRSSSVSHKHLSYNSLANNHHQAPPRTRSPFSRSHLRSRSSGAAFLSAPAMTRAHSMPNPQLSLAGHDQTRPVSPLASSGSPSTPYSPMRSPARVRSPFRVPSADDAAFSAPPPRSPGTTAIQSIQEDSELDIFSRGSAVHSGPGSASASFSRSGSLRRRPASPLHSAQTPSSPYHRPSSPAGTPPTAHTPSMVDVHAAAHLSRTNTASPPPGQTSSNPRFTETFPQHLPLRHHSSASSFNTNAPSLYSSYSSAVSSVPSTPTSMRSRSPSIASLEPIEDAPDLEELAAAAAALELDGFNKLAAVEEDEEEDARESGNNVIRRRSSLDTPRSSGGVGFGFGRPGVIGGGGNGGPGEKKRWSICGGERRGDLLDLETIWED